MQQLKKLDILLINFSQRQFSIYNKIRKTFVYACAVIQQDKNNNYT